MTTSTLVKCACESCLCTVDPSQAIARNGQYYCSEACANGHTGGSKGCGHPGCTCHS